MPRTELDTLTAGKWFARTALSMALAGLQACASDGNAETQCTTRPAVGGGTITTCRESGSGQPAQQFRTRPAIGGGTITTGNGTTCTTRPAVGGGVITACR